MKTAAVVLALLLAVWPRSGPPVQIVTLRGKPQQLRLFGDPRATPAIVVSGDGGWLHLGPHVAEVLASRGYHVIGFDAKAYLSSFTAGSRTLSVEDVQRDFATLVSVAATDTPARPVLVGVSEGAGLAVLAGADPALKPRIAGVVALGLGDRNELGWRWKDSLIYITKGVPDEPTFSAVAYVDRMSPVPLALVQSTRDEYVTAEETSRLVARARDPKRLWLVRASNHRFSDNLGEFDASLLEACAWIRTQSAVSSRQGGP